MVNKVIITLLCALLGLAHSAVAFAPRATPSRGVVARQQAPGRCALKCSALSEPISRRGALALAGITVAGVAGLVPTDSHAELDADDQRILAGYKTVTSRRVCVCACVRVCVRACVCACERASERAC
jgi:hypothetical protein